jgi:hypothetical protein
VGKMKKLDKPIELKGRIIKYSTDVYLDKKSSTVKTGKKVGNKMRGGNQEYFYCSFNIQYITDYIRRKYKTEFQNEFDIDINPRNNFTLKLVSYGHVFITNRSKGKFLREDNKAEQIAIYACVSKSNTICFAILRCNFVTQTVNIDFQSKILFLIPNKSKLEKIHIESLRINGKEQKINNNFLSFYQFRSFISSNGDLYRIIILNNETDYHKLPTFFCNLSRGINITYLTTDELLRTYPKFTSVRGETSDNALDDAALFALIGIRGLAA